MSRTPWSRGDWPGHTGNWDRWSNDRGALNLIGPQSVLRALSRVSHGDVIPCSRPLAAHDPIIPEPVYRHEMICAGRVPHWPEREVLNASDRISAWMHGTANTHIDALAHIGFRGIGFGGRAHADMVSMDGGVSQCDVTSALGVVTRVWFVDVPRRRGVPYLQPGDRVLPADIAPEVDLVQPGDAFFVRLGVTLAPGTCEAGSADVHGQWAGLHPDCVELLGPRGVAIIGTDGPGDSYPSPLTGVCDSPVHVLCAVFWGIHLIHNMDLERLAQRCAETGRNDGALVVAGLNIERGTGSIITPLVLL